MSACAVGEYWNRIGQGWTELTHSLLDDMLCIQVLVLFRFCIQRRFQLHSIEAVQAYLYMSLEDDPKQEPISGQPRNTGYASYRACSPAFYTFYK